MKPSSRLIRVLRRLLLGGAVLATLLAAFVLEENWRGDRAWAAAEREFAAKGDSLVNGALLRPPVPEAENLFKTPQLALILYGRHGEKPRQKLLAEYQFVEFAHRVGYDNRQKSFSDLRDQLKSLGLLGRPYSDAPAADIFQAMQRMQPLLDELREAARLRPRAEVERSPVPLQFATPGIGDVFRLGQMLNTRIAVEFELGRVDDARADLLVLQRLGGGLTEHPANLLCVMVGVALLNGAVDAVSDGCARHVWSDADLARFQKRAGEVHLAVSLGEALRVDRANGFAMMDAPHAMPWDNGAWPIWLFHGWAQQNKATYSRRLDEQIFARLASDPERILPAATALTPMEPAGVFPSPFEWLSRLALPDFGKLVTRFAISADHVRLTPVTWALERHRLAHGHYPEKLDELVPAFLPAVPAGIFDGQPVRYGPRPEGGHQIYSLGPNSRDDGGKADDIVMKLPDAL